MPVATGKCPACGLKMGERTNRPGRFAERPGMYRCRRCKTAIRVEKGYGSGSLISVVPNEHGELNLVTIPRV